jgi:hypothetical protein
MKFLKSSLALLLAHLACLPAFADIAHVQQVLESTDDFGDQIMVATLPGAVTVGNGVVVVTIPEVGGISVTSITGAAASFTLLEGPQAAIGHAAIATATTAAQTVNVDDTTDFNGDVVFVHEASGVASPLDESGTSLQLNNGTNVTDHDFGTITPDGTDTAYYVAIVFSGNPGTISNATGTTLTDWTEVSTGLTTHRIYRRVVNNSGSGVRFHVTSSTARQSHGIFFALNGAAEGGASGLLLRRRR